MAFVWFAIISGIKYYEMNQDIICNQISLLFPWHETDHSKTGKYGIEIRLNVACCNLQKLWRMYSVTKLTDNEWKNISFLLPGLCCSICFWYTSLLSIFFVCFVFCRLVWRVGFTLGFYWWNNRNNHKHRKQFQI